MPTGTANLAWARAIIDALVRGGIAHVCVSPGSRSAPLAVAVAERDDLASSVHVDERAAGFFALGAARAAGRPVGLVCTSGTAAANYLPAVVEAHYACVPLLVLTADRPPELRDTGAWQTIDQLRLYGTYARWFHDLAVPDPALLPYARNVACRALATATARPAGPVHLNLPFREPLLPEGYPTAEGSPSTRPEPRQAGPPHADAGLVAVPESRTLAAEGVVTELADRIRAASRGILIAGALPPVDGYAPALARLADLAGYPVLAEPTGHMRYGAHDRSLVVDHYEALLRAPGFREAHVPQLALRFGATPVWKQVAQWLACHPEVPQVVVDPQGTWDDPTRLATDRLVVDPVPLLTALSERLADRLPNGDRAWPDAWLLADRRAGRALERLASSGIEQATDQAHRGPALDAPREAPDGRSVAPSDARDVAWVYRTLGERLPSGTVVHVANSMAVRDLCSFLPQRSADLRVYANRGAAGIDGTVSSGLGASLGSGRPTVVITGDLAFAHDVGGLQASRLPGLKATILVIDDAGGSIFRYLPARGLPATLFEPFFVAPSGLAVAHACAAYGVGHAVVRDPDALAEALGECIAPGVRVLQIPVDPAANEAFHRRYWQAVAEAVGGASAE